MTTRASRKNKGIFLALWTEQSIIGNRHSAIKAFQNGTMTLYKAVQQFKIPKTTLRQRIQGENKIATGSKKHLGRNTDLPLALENQLAQHICYFHKI